MSALYPASLVDDRTLEAIKASRPGRPSSASDPYACGCHHRLPDNWYLCDYHEGYDSALEVYGDE